MHKVRSIQKWFVKIGVKELDWPAQSLNLNPIKHLWDELERQLRARQFIFNMGVTLPTCT
jgi:hypothetical protein